MNNPTKQNEVIMCKIKNKELIVDLTTNLKNQTYNFLDQSANVPL